MSLAQIGEFSFILAGLGTSLGILPAEGRDLILAGAILSILANPFLFRFVADRTAREVEQAAHMRAAAAYEVEARKGHVILVGYGRVGRLIAAGLRERGRALIVIEDQPDVARRAEQDGLDVVKGNAADGRALAEAGIGRAAKLLIAIPEGFEGGAVAERARRIPARFAGHRPRPFRRRGRPSRAARRAACGDGRARDRGQDAAARRARNERSQRCHRSLRTPRPISASCC